MTKALIIVESPAKARTISKFLGSDYEVESSIGHIRDLPSSAAEIPAKYKKEPWSRLGVDVVSDFKPLYVVPHGKKKQVDKLKRHLKEASELLLATDEDRATKVRDRRHDPATVKRPLPAPEQQATHPIARGFARQGRRFAQNRCHGLLDGSCLDP